MKTSRAARSVAQESSRGQVNPVLSKDTKSQVVQLERLPKALDQAVHQTLPQWSALGPLPPRLMLLQRKAPKSRLWRWGHLRTMLTLLSHQDPTPVSGQVTSPRTETMTLLARKTEGPSCPEPTSLEHRRPLLIPLVLEYLMRGLPDQHVPGKAIAAAHLALL